MSNPFWKLTLWVLGFAAFFLIVLSSLVRFTDVEFIEIVTAMNAIGILVAICVGGVFAYQRLQIFRTFTPHMTISHEITHRLVSDSYIHIAITATLHNSSKVHIELREGFFLLQRIAPATDEEVGELYAQVVIDEQYENMQWPAIYRRERAWDEGELIVEPGASHPETYEFIVPQEVRAVSIYTYFDNPRFTPNNQSTEGWGKTTIYDIVNED